MASRVSQEEVFDEDDMQTALCHFRKHQKLARPHVEPEAWTIDNVKRSSAGIKGWLEWNPDTLLRVGEEVFPADLCGLWARQALCAANEKPQWERVVLTVDSGASDTVIPPSVACNVPLVNTLKTGIEYEVANGGVITNLGERQAKVKMSGMARSTSS